MLTIVIGAGPSGLCAAFSSANDNNQVIVIEKNNKVGKKLFITGKGRCNVTNNCSNQQFIDNVVNNKQFLYSSISNFNPSDTISLFNELNVELITERGNRVFPKSNHAYDISDALKRKCVSSGVKFHLNEEVISIEKEDEHFILKTNRNIYYPDFVVIATGGKSYPLTGSTGDGYRFASFFNHQIIEPIPGLVGLKIKEEVNNNLNGFTLKNVTLTAKYSDKKICIVEFEIIDTKQIINKKNKLVVEKAQKLKDMIRSKYNYTELNGIREEIYIENSFHLTDNDEEYEYQKKIIEKYKKFNHSGSEI